MNNFVRARKLRQTQKITGKTLATILLLILLIVTLCNCHYVKPVTQVIPQSNYEQAVTLCNNIDIKYHNILNILQNRINTHTLQTDDKEQLDILTNLYIQTMKDCINITDLAKQNKLTPEILANIRNNSEKFLDYLINNPI